MPMQDKPLKGVLEPHPHGPTVEGLEKLAWLMDRSMKIPGTNISVGLDAILGLLPIGGDALTGIIQTGIVLAAIHYYKVPKVIAARMAGNVLLDTLVGSIPFLGDMFDVAFKANTRNIQLLHHVQEQRAAGSRVAVASSFAWLGVIAALLIGTVGLVAIGAIAVIGWLINRPLI